MKGWQPEKKLVQIIDDKLAISVFYLEFCPSADGLRGVYRERPPEGGTPNKSP